MYLQCIQVHQFGKHYILKTELKRQLFYKWIHIHFCDSWKTAAILFSDTLL